MKICEGKIIELDPNKWYWLIVRRGYPAEDLERLRMQNGTIMFVDDFKQIEFVENPERIKGIVVKEF